MTLVIGRLSLIPDRLTLQSDQANIHRQQPCHAADFDQLMNCPEFDYLTKDATGRMKPVVTTTVDGGPDENPLTERLYKWEFTIS